MQKLTRQSADEELDLARRLTLIAGSAGVFLGLLSLIFAYNVSFDDSFIP